MERRYSVPPPASSSPPGDPVHPPRAAPGPMGPSASEDLHAWSIYRQNLNSDFTDSALGSSEKSPLPYGNFQLRESTVQSILSHPRYGPKSALGSNMYTYLKFGLPRVFPPSRGPRDGSSGYDSSDDGSPYLHHQGRNYLRSRSDPDFRNHVLHKPYSGHGPRPGPPPPGGGRRTRSSSEANLLSQEAHYRHHHEQRRSMHDLRAVPYLEMEHPGVTTNSSHRKTSKTGSHMSVQHPHPPPHRREDLNSRLGPVSEGGMLPQEAYYVEHMEATGVSKYPHLQVRGVDVDAKSKQKVLLLSGISFEVHGGEIMAIMATSEEEGTGLLDALSGRYSTIGNVRGDILLNGQSVSPSQLRDRVAYVQSDSHLCPDLTVRQTLGFHHALRRESKINTSASIIKVTSQHRINALIEDLGLDQVRYTKVAGLTTSEKRRLNVACHLLLNTDIVVLDQPTIGMDIFDTFFLVEFLRQWAGNGSTGGLSGGRIVILTLHPPTYEIFTMLSRVALVSAGRLMYTGRRRDMLPYFALVDYPCPAYKNPSDYYLDLVTLDDLSAEAMLESSQRIEQLAEVFRRRQIPLSDPGPPVALPCKVRQANFLSQFGVLLARTLIYAQPLSLVHWITHLLLAVSLSIIVGALFWDLPNTDPHLVFGDRIGFYYMVGALALWPLLLRISLGEIKRERWAVRRDLQDRLYNRGVYLITKALYNIPASACVWLAYLAPAYLMTGLQFREDDSSDFGQYLGLMLLYLLALQMLLYAVGLAVPWTLLASVLAGLLVMCFCLVSGLLLHHDDLGEWCNWLAPISPSRQIMSTLIHQQYMNGTVKKVCANKQVQYLEIIVQQTCPTPNATQALVYSGLLVDSKQPSYVPALTVAVFWFICFLVTAGGLLICRYRPRRPRSSPNKP